MPHLLQRTLVDPLPEALRENAGVTVFEPDGTIRAQIGFEDGFESVEDARAAEADRGNRDRAVFVADHPSRGFVALSVGLDVAESFGGAVQALFDAGMLRQQLETELESMSMSSLALLEEAAMVTEVMTELSTGDSERQIVEQGLNSLVVGAAATRGLYYRFDVGRDVFELLAHVEFDSKARRTKRADAAIDMSGGGLLFPMDGLLARAAETPRDSAILQNASPSQGVSGPEGVAQAELLAAPVWHGQDETQRLLGVLVLADKRATSYSDIVEFGSHETKLTSGLASMLAAVLGARMSAEFGKELEMATSIQQQILPDRPAVVEGFELAGRCDTSGAVGGDYFDYLSMNDGRTMCVVADVSGHNLASGMVMVSARSALRLLAATKSEIASVFNDLASTLYTDLNRTERFITAAGATIAPGSSTVEVVNAGHNDTMIFRAATGAVERIPSEDTILGFLPGIEYEVQQLEIGPGDVIVLYTDGVTEAVDKNGEMFDETRLVEVLKEFGKSSAQEILDAIYDAVSAFHDVESGSDDVTAMVIRCTAGVTDEQGESA